MTAKIGINGFGRIGRCLFRLNFEEPVEKKFEVVTIKDIIPIKNIAYLLKYDSHYGNFKGEVDVEGDYLIIDGKKIPYFNELDIKKVPWEKFGTNIIVESSGQPTSEITNSLIKDELKNVIYPRNFKGADITLVYGFNHTEYNPDKHKVLSASSCTGTALVPIIDIIHSNFGIEHGHLVTIHPVLSDQKLIDVSHEKFHLGRNALASIIPTSTGIAESVETAIPNLKGKFTAISYRVPTTVVSIVDVSLHLRKKVTVEDINSVIKKYSENDLKGIISYDEGYFGHSKVSIDFLKSPYSAIVFGLETQANGNDISLSIFHDNEWGYCQRLHDLINYVHSKNG